MSALRAALGLLVAALLSAGLVLGSRIPVTVASPDDAFVRLSWRAVGERVEACREPSAEELAQLPPHMRRREICEGRVLPFRLTARVDGALRVDRTVRAAGAREDRPAYVFEKLRVAPGAHRLRVRFEIEAPEGSAAAQRPALQLDRRVEIGPRRILLVTTDEEGDSLRVVASEQAPPAGPR